MKTVLANGDREAAIADAQAGMNRPALVEKYKVSDGTAANIRREAGVTGRRKEEAARPEPSVVGHVAPARVRSKPRGNKTDPEPTTPGWMIVATKVAVVLVTAVAALLSYSGLRKLALEAGLGWHADLLPLAVDGLVAVCLLVRTVQPKNGVARLAMWLALVASVAANAYVYGHPWNTHLLIIASAMAGFAPIAAGVGYHLLGRMQVER